MINLIWEHGELDTDAIDALEILHRTMQGLLSHGFLARVQTEEHEGVTTWTLVGEDAREGALGICDVADVLGINLIVSVPT